MSQNTQKLLDVFSILTLERFARCLTCTYIESDQGGNNLPLTAKELKKHDAQRNFGAELLESMRTLQD